MRTGRISWVASSVVLGSMFATASVYAETVFYDDFSDGDLDGWSVADGTTASIVDGSLEISRNGFARIRPEGVALGDISIRTQVRALAPSTNFGIGVMVRRQTGQSPPCYYAGVADTGEYGGDSFWGVCNGDDFPEIDTDFDVLEEDVLLQLDVIGNQLSLWTWRPDEPMPAKPHATIEDDLLTSGVVDLWINAIPSGSVRGAFRFVHIANAHIPEPSTLLLCIIALAVVSGWRKRRG